MSDTAHALYVKNTRHVRSVRSVGRGGYVIQFDRHDRPFESGQYLNVGPVGRIDMREYSIYSGVNDDYFEILVKKIEQGLVSPLLCRLCEKNMVNVDGPFGFFTIPPDWSTKKFLFVATGTGISPFRSFVRSYPALDYRLLHGVRYFDECYDRSEYDIHRYTACVTREQIPAQSDETYDWKGRVTSWIRAHPVAPDTLCYLCGNCDMIYEMYDILQEQGLPSTNLCAEVYF